MGGRVIYGGIVDAQMLNFGYDGSPAVVQFGASFDIHQLVFVAINVKTL
jgi:hypothetical protein